MVKSTTFFKFAFVQSEASNDGQNQNLFTLAQSNSTPQVKFKLIQQSMLS